MILGVALAAPLAAEPRVWLDEHFSDGERDRQNPPESAAWFSSSAASTLAVSPGALVQSGGGRHVLAYFTPAGAPAGPAPGETLVFTCEFALTSPMDGPGAFRLGLFNSNGTRIVADKHGRSDDFMRYSGYMGAANPAPSKPLPLSIFKRVATNSDILIGALPPFQAISAPGGGTQSLKNDRIYQGTFKIRRPASGPGLAITFGFTGEDLTGHEVATTDSAAPVLLFDTVVVHTGTRGSQGFTLKSVRIETRTE